MQRLLAMESLSPPFFSLSPLLVIHTGSTKIQICLPIYFFFQL